MTKTKWGFFYGAVIFVDILQIILDLLVVGALVNRVIDVFVGILLPFSLHICGVKMTDTKRIMSVIAAFGFEMIPEVDALPLWTLDLVIIQATYLSEAKLKEKAPKIAAGMQKMAEAAGQIKNPLNKDGVRLPTGRDTI